MARYWPLSSGRIVTSPFGPRDGGFHAGTDFGFPGGSGGRPVYACASGTVIYAGPRNRAGQPVLDAAGGTGNTVVDGDAQGTEHTYGHLSASSAPACD